MYLDEELDLDADVAEIQDVVEAEEVYTGPSLPGIEYDGVGRSDRRHADTPNSRQRGEGRPGSARGRYVEPSSAATGGGWRGAMAAAILSFLYLFIYLFF